MEELNALHQFRRILGGRRCPHRSAKLRYQGLCDLRRPLERRADGEDYLGHLQREKVGRAYAR